jgi:phage FluMu gp28-like protein
MCNPMGATANRIVEWSAIERCRSDYEIERVHLEADDVRHRFGEFNPSSEQDREYQIGVFLRSSFLSLFGEGLLKNPKSKIKNPRLGFDVAASGQGDLATIYVDEARGDELWLRGLFTCRTEDWHFLKTVLFYFLQRLPGVQAAGDESGLGRQICWEAAEHFGSRFMKVNFASKKHDLGFALMNQLAVAEKRFPRSEDDIAADYFALRKAHNGSKWSFSEGRNSLNAASHCDIAWAGALASFAHTERRCSIGAAVALDNCWFDGREYHPYKQKEPEQLSPSAEHQLMWSDDPSIWRPLR